MAMSSKEQCNRAGTKAKDQKSVRFVDPPGRFDGECRSTEFEAPRRTSDPDHQPMSFKFDEGDFPQPHRDPELYCVGRRGSIPVPEDVLCEGVTKADGSPVLSILKKGKISVFTVTGSDSSLASNPWNLSRDSNEDMIAPTIPQRYTSEDVSTDDSLDIPIDQANISRPQTRRESNRDVFLRQFLRKT